MAQLAEPARSQEEADEVVRAVMAAAQADTRRLRRHNLRFRGPESP